MGETKWALHAGVPLAPGVVHPPPRSLPAAQLHCGQLLEIAAELLDVAGTETRGKRRKERTLLDRAWHGACVCVRVRLRMCVCVCAREPQYSAAALNIRQFFFSPTRRTGSSRFPKKGIRGGKKRAHACGA